VINLTHDDAALYAGTSRGEEDTGVPPVGEVARGLTARRRELDARVRRVVKHVRLYPGRSDRQIAESLHGAANVRYAMNEVRSILREHCERRGDGWYLPADAPPLPPPLPPEPVPDLVVPVRPAPLPPPPATPAPEVPMPRAVPREDKKSIEERLYEAVCRRPGLPGTAYIREIEPGHNDPRILVQQHMLPLEQAGRVRREGQRKHTRWYPIDASPPQGAKPVEPAVLTPAVDPAAEASSSGGVHVGVIESPPAASAAGASTAAPDNDPHEDFPTRSHKLPEVLISLDGDKAFDGLVRELGLDPDEDDVDEKAIACVRALKVKAEQAAVAVVERDGARRLLEERGRQVSDAMGRYRGTDELVPAVKAMAERVDVLAELQAMLRPYAIDGEQWTAVLARVVGEREEGARLVSSLHAAMGRHRGDEGSLVDAVRRMSEELDDALENVRRLTAPRPVTAVLPDPPAALELKVARLEGWRDGVCEALRLTGGARG
jgi:hypothetical protein